MPFLCDLSPGRGKLTMKIRRGFVFIAILASIAAGKPAKAAPKSSGTAREPASGASDLHLSDPHKELLHLSRDLKLKKDQRAGVGSILEERDREIRLLLDNEPLSQEYQEYRDRLAARVLEDSNAQIESLLRRNQKRKFDKELARDHETR